MDLQSMSLFLPCLLRIIWPVACGPLSTKTNQYDPSTTHNLWHRWSFSISCHLSHPDLNKRLPHVWSFKQSAINTQIFNTTLYYGTVHLLQIHNLSCGYSCSTTTVSYMPIFVTNRIYPTGHPNWTKSHMTIYHASELLNSLQSIVKMIHITTTLYITCFIFQPTLSLFLSSPAPRRDFLLEMVHHWISEQVSFPSFSHCPQATKSLDHTGLISFSSLSLDPFPLNITLWKN